MRRLRQHWPLLRTLQTIGVTADEVFVALAIRTDPLRVTGLFRAPLPGIDRAERGEVLVRAAAGARRALRAPAGTPVVIALQPADRRLRIDLADGWGRQTVEVRGQPSVVAALETAGFTVERFDAAPVALARLAGGAPPPSVTRAAGWTVRASATTLEAWAGAGPASPLAAPGLRLPAAVRRRLRADLDSVAAGAALRGAGVWPDLLVDVVEPRPAAPRPPSRDGVVPDPGAGRSGERRPTVGTAVVGRPPR